MKETRRGENIFVRTRILSFPSQSLSDNILCTVCLWLLQLLQSQKSDNTALFYNTLHGGDFATLWLANTQMGWGGWVTAQVNWHRVYIHLGQVLNLDSSISSVSYTRRGRKQQWSYNLAPLFYLADLNKWRGYTDSFLRVATARDVISMCTGKLCNQIARTSA